MYAMNFEFAMGHATTLKAVVLGMTTKIENPYLQYDLHALLVTCQCLLRHSQQCMDDFEFQYTTKLLK